MSHKQRASTANFDGFAPDPQFRGRNRMETSAAKQHSNVRGSMATAEQSYLRAKLEVRRERLPTGLHSRPAYSPLSQLLATVDDPLPRIDQETFGLCEPCHD